MLKKLFATLIMLGMFGVMAGCNTIEGFGKDVERGGEKVQGTAKDVKKDM